MHWNKYTYQQIYYWQHLNWFTIQSFQGFVLIMKPSLNRHQETVDFKYVITNIILSSTFSNLILSLKCQLYITSAFEPLKQLSVKQKHNIIGDNNIIKRWKGLWVTKKCIKRLKWHYRNVDVYLGKLIKYKNIDGKMKGV